jgi:cysteine desulfurase
MLKKTYLDNAATTRTDQRVLDVMLPLFNEYYGNASSLHSFGVEAKEIMDRSREKIGSYIGAKPEEIVFTSGGTESNNFAIKGIAWANRQKGNHIIVSSIEHDCILNACKWLKDQGYRITYLPVDSKGIIDTDYLRHAITDQTILVSVMYANNEIGTIEPIDEIGEICGERNIWFHCDACQSFGKVPIDVNQSKIDLLTVNAHKIYGPKGIGALYVRKGVILDPLLHGGGQEHGMRSTTENLPAIAGFAKAAELCYHEQPAEIQRLNGLRSKLEKFLLEETENAYMNGHEHMRLPGHLNFSFHGLEGETIRLLLLLDEKGIAVSAGSACSSNDTSHSSSHVLRAIGLDSFQSRGGIRVSFGRFTTEEEVDYFIQALKECIPMLNTLFTH